MSHIDQITAELKADQDITIIEFFTEQSDSKKIKGSIQVSQNGLVEPIIFDVKILPNYPFSKTSFIPKGIRWYRHQLIDGEICLPDIKHQIAIEKFREEISALKLWIDKYYLNDTVDDHYEYLLIERSDASTIFFSDTIRNFKSNECGFFSYSILPFYQESQKYLVHEFKLNIRSHSWEPTVSYSSYLSKGVEKFWGIWIYFDHEPIVYRRKIANTWKELSEHLTVENLDLILSFHVSKKSGNGELKVLIGYPIIEKGISETHWEILIIKREDFPISRKKDKIRIGCDSLEKKLYYGYSKNISYNRYFGRGALFAELCESKILIIGTGAVGSNLAEIFARGGVRFLDLVDNDVVEPGNICRSVFRLFDVEQPKVLSLQNRLIQISPYIQVNDKGILPKITTDQTKQIEYLKGELNQYSWIFNCSTDMELAFMLDQMDLNAQVFNFSISNEAKEFVAATGKSIVSRKNLFFRDLDSSPATFYEGAGCFSPTFKASYSDINALLHYAVKHINHRLETRFPLTSFIIRTEKTDIGTIEIKLYAD